MKNAPQTIEIGALLFPGIDQIDLTGPFEVLSRLPGARYRLYGLTMDPVRDIKGLQLTPDATIAEVPHLDILHVPGGPGQQALMENEQVLNWLRDSSSKADRVLSVCTGALLLGAAGLLKGRPATTHWASHHLLPYFGAIPLDQRVVVDDKWTFAAGVTAGIDGALRLVADLAGDAVAQGIQLAIAYAPEPPFQSGTPATAPADVLRSAREAITSLTAQRQTTAELYAKRLGIENEGSAQTSENRG